MAELDAIGDPTSYRHPREGGERGAILFDDTCLSRPRPEWFTAEHWGHHAEPVQAGGRGGAWFIDAPFGAAVLRHYLRGGMAARLSRDRYLWQGETHVRSFAEYRLTRSLLLQGLPVARPIAASYVRSGASYRAAILVERLRPAATFAQCVERSGTDAPWAQAGRLIARFHQTGLDHADLNANNILIGDGGQAWLIDFDRSRLRKPARTWRHNNLARLLRSLHKLRGERSRAHVERDFVRLQYAYDVAFAEGDA